ncbi:MULTISPECIES: hydroxyethylthiazole kinase [unclassified Spirosoma]|uniref:hydroxyethylthiazole kinase n=1 Tax=unclassified Spirosoma TaxID=2621999 RepID=UPI00095ACD91|nr:MULTISPECIES: hydroxyethylthiazole kinase [unclassified Spirosoma]MBN8821810.1 hydroxyethylthiazole kinase [Spirosoma sp.]OJW80700.1 MAG: hydroxyethylthiazole kinase [Spirosoma sp. 48-14]
MTEPATLIWTDVERIRAQVPLVHNITNFVVMNNTANALLALGASPAMVHAPEEVEEFVSISSALVVNIGTLDATFVAGMKRAMKQAKALGKPIVFDPVGVGATSFRNQVSEELLTLAAPDIIRGNASEIMALAGLNAQTKGVDSLYGSEAAVDAAQRLSSVWGSVVVISGETDYIIHGDQTAKIANGHPLMTKVTGMGCTATALTGAFAAVNTNYFQAATHAMAVMGIAGELAVSKNAAPGSLQVNFLDMLYQLSEADIANTLNLA